MVPDEGKIVLLEEGQSVVNWVIEDMYSGNKKEDHWIAIQHTKLQILFY